VASEAAAAFTGGDSGVHRQRVTGSFDISLTSVFRACRLFRVLQSE
jgi:hypothetical protein